MDLNFRLYLILTFPQLLFLNLPTAYSLENRLLLKNSFSLKLDLKSALLLGLFQSIAILPGISRSGMVISSALMMGLDKEKSIQYCFFMVIPVIVLSIFYELLSLIDKIDKKNKIISIKEKPKKFLSDLAITGLYFFDNNVVKFAKKLKPSRRGEVEIVDLLNMYKSKKQLSADLIGRGGAWLDTGSPDSLLEAGQFVQTIEHRQGFKIACLEEIAYLNGWIGSDEVEKIANSLDKTSYGKYLKDIIK